MVDGNDITGRDRLILSEALATAIVVLSELPAERQPSSNVEDMKTILAEIAGGQDISLHLAQAKVRLRPAGKAPWDIYREYGFDDIADTLEKRARDAGETGD